MPNKALHPAAARPRRCPRHPKLNRPIRKGRLLSAVVGELCVGHGAACIVVQPIRFWLTMNDNTQHTVIRRARLREDLKPIPCLSGSDATEVDWLAIAHVTNARGVECFDLVFLRSDGAAFPLMGFETLMIAKAQAHAVIGVEFVEWEPCEVELTNEDRTISWERALPGAGQAACI